LVLNKLHIGYFPYFLIHYYQRGGGYRMVEFNVQLDTVETGALSTDVHLSFSNGGPAT